MQQRAQDIIYTKQPYIEDVGPRRIKSIQFSTMSGSDILKASECQVHLGQYYDANKKAIVGGLLDTRMGAPNKHGTCQTCGGSFTDCPGHFGYLNLVLPVYNVGYLSTILDILKCICKSCSRVLIDEKLRKSYLKRMRNPRTEPLKKNELMKEIVKKCSTMASSKAVKCLRCGYMNGMVKKAGSVVGIIHDRSKLSDGYLEECKSAIGHTREARAPIGLATYILNPVKVLSLFQRMVEVDCELLYLQGRPEKLIITTIAVPPISIRPSVFTEGSQSNENDITERLKQIIQFNAKLRLELLEGRRTGIKYLIGWDELQAVVTLYINSDVRIPLDMQVGRPLSGFVQRLTGKQGRFRQNLAGKRVEFTGRTVISPDPNLKITEVAIPIHMARILTYPERVTHHNIEKLRQCVNNGSYKYPGARMVTYPDGSSKMLTGNYRKRIAEELKSGCIVHRHLEDGDVVLFNRQPSLHRMSIMCHRARIMPWRTLRFNESVCNPYNADFDGDEMNMHVPQTEEARTEAFLLMGVQNNLCTPKNGEILVASTQDFLTSSFLITRKDTFYDRAAFSLMCSYMNDGMDLVDLPTPSVLKPIELWTGKQLFSVLLRPHANVRVYINLIVKEKNYSKPNKEHKKERETMCPNDGYVYFRNSELISGQLGKATLGNGNKDGLYSILLRDYNAYAAATCMNRLAKLSARWIGNHGFSIGIDDVQPGKKLVDEKGKTISNGYRHCNKLIADYNGGRLALKPGCDATQTLETEITERLNKLREEAGDVCMKELHWRNSPLIMSQCGSKGSPINISQMIACVGQQSVGGSRAPDGFIDRSLPHFPRKSKTPAAKGFVANSFYSGLSATEFFFHTMGGREGLVDTAVKTADTGYMARRLSKGLEDLCVQYDNTVQDAGGGIVQFLYGDDGLDPAIMEGKAGVPLNFDRLFMKVKATCGAEEDEYLSPSDISNIVQSLLLKHNGTLDGICSESFRKSLSSFLGDQAKRLECLMKLVDGVEVENFDNIKNVEGRTGISKNTEKIAQKVSGITEKQLEVFLKTCLDRYVWKRIEPGTAIGAIGAQSIGEPGTQMTLKTFHFAGVASMNITQGVPRIKEIINGAKRISTPIITVELEHNSNVNAARIIKGRIQKTVLGQVAKSIKIVMTSRSASVKVTLDMPIHVPPLSLLPLAKRNCEYGKLRGSTPTVHTKALPSPPLPPINKLLNRVIILLCFSRSHQIPVWWVVEGTVMLMMMAEAQSCVLLLTMMISFTIVSANNGVFSVKYKYAGLQRSLSDLKAHDDQRQLRILAGVDLPLGGIGRPDILGLYYAKIGIGTPTKDYYVQVDTGSDIMWVNCIQCRECPKTSSLGIDLTLYNINESDTGKLVPCDQEFCYEINGGQLPGCTTNMSCPYLEIYGDGSSTAGYFVKDVVQYARVSGDLKTTAANGSVIFGCGARQSGDLGSSNEEALDGILGFGKSNSSMISQLAVTGKVKKIFAHCLDGTNGGGIFVIGHVVQPKVNMTPLIPNQPHYNVNMTAVQVGHEFLSLPTDVFEAGDRKGAIIDSGTTLAYLPEMVYKPLVSKIISQQPDLKVHTVRDEYTCFQYSDSLDDGFPNVTFHFENSVILKVYPHEYLFPFEGLWCIGWQNSGVQSRDRRNMTLLGDLVLSNKLVLYDLENQAIGWTEYNCSSSIQVLDERTGTVHLVGYHYINSARSLNVPWAMLLLLLPSTLLLSLVC